jgi:3-methyladenine DNA glycosylase Mpg
MPILYKKNISTSCSGSNVRSILLKLARRKQEEEERCQTVIETETYDGDNDMGEHDWD